jgi:ribonuclease HII
VKIVAGIDEAGYAPTLGPLVVSATIFGIEDGDVDFWDALAGSVAKKASPNSEKLIVNDSKKVYSGARRCENLETAVLSFLGCRTHCASVDGLMRGFSLHGAAEFSDVPWYRDLGMALPAWSNPEHITRSSTSLLEAIRQAGIQFLGAKTVPVTALHLNRDLERTRNKSVTLFGYTLELIDHMRNAHADGDLDVIVDKHGGRMRYGQLLASGFWGEEIKVVKQTSVESVYELVGGRGRTRISFVEKADEKFFPVSLSSMLSKYVRELFMFLFNGYWTARVKGLTPTSGYPTDARRFLEQIRAAARHHPEDWGMLIRAR